MEQLTKRIDQLISLQFSSDIPDLLVGPLSLNYVASSDTNFEDYAAFSTGMTRFLNEAATIRNLNDIVRLGRDKYCSLLYTWRSITRALPSVHEDMPKKTEIYESCYRLIKPKIELLFDLYKFSTMARDTFVSEANRMCLSEFQKEGTSRGLVLQMGQMLDMLSTLDDLRSAKTSVKNDLATYKRLETITRNLAGDSDRAKLIANVTFFLAQPNEIMNSLGKALEAISGYLSILAVIVNVACEQVENKMYIAPAERHHYLRTILAALSIMAHDKNCISFLEKKKVPLSRIDKVLRDTPAIPLIGDMHSNVAIMLKRLNIPYEWSLSDQTFSQKLASSFNICSYLDQFQDEYMLVMTEYSMYKCTGLIQNIRCSNLNFSSADAQTLYTFALKATRFLAKWNYTLMEVFFYKMSHPAEKSMATGASDLSDNYSLATKYNYSNTEKSAIARIIFFIKSLYGALRESEICIMGATNTHIYNSVQSFMNTTMQELNRKVNKSKSHLFRSVVESIILILSDAVDNTEPTIKGKKNVVTYALRSKPVSPLSSQYYMGRTMLNALLVMKETKKLIDSSIVTQIVSFDREASFHNAMSNYGDTLVQCSQMSMYWYKEFYIEISCGTRVQYPIDVSFPWIIINYLIESNEPDSYEFILYVMDIYNDSAQFALTKLSQQHLYDEIDAEVQLVFQQMTYLLSEKLYNITRAEAFGALINKSLKNQIIKRLLSVDKSLTNEVTIPYQTAHQILNLCKQRNVQYLGRNIDLNCLLSQRLIIKLKSSLEACFGYFEASSLENIVLLSALIDVFEMTHSILSKNFDLPKFSLLLNEVNSMMPGFLPRITGQVLIFLINDVSCNYSYSSITQKYVLSPVLFSERSTATEQSRALIMPIYGSRIVGVAYEEYYGVYSKHIGDAHFRAIFKLIGYSGVSFICEELLKYISSSIAPILTEYVTVLVKGMPTKCILPRAAYGFAGILQYFDATLEAILRYPDIRSGVLHQFRQLGNLIAFVYQLEQAVYAQESFCLYHTAAHCGIMSDASVKPTTSSIDAVDSTIVNDRPKTLTNMLKNCMLTLAPLPPQAENLQQCIQKTHVFNQERLCCGLSFFSKFLKSLAPFFNSPAWLGMEPTNGVISIDECTEFHRLFSAILYYLAQPLSEFNTTNELVFGDGVLFAGLSLITVFNQRFRFEALDFNMHAVNVSHAEATVSSVTLGLISGTGTVRQTGTLKPKTLKPAMDSSKSELSDDNRKILQRMKDQIRRREHITNIIYSYYTRRGFENVESVKCFYPPLYSS